MRPKISNILRRWGLAVIFVCLWSSPVAPLVFQSKDASNSARAEGGGWSFYIEGVTDYSVDVGEKDPYGDDLDWGCYGNYAGEWGVGSTPDSASWARINPDGKIEGGCNIQEGDRDNGRLIVGTLSGKFATDAISDVHIETSETITVPVDGKVTWGKATLIVNNGSGGPEKDEPGEYTITGKFTFTYQDSDGYSEMLAGTVTMAASIWPIGPSFQLDRSEAARFSAIKVTGAGFKKQTGAAKILFNGEEIYRVNLDTEGNLIAGAGNPILWIWVPDDAPFGINKVWVETEHGEKSNTVELNVVKIGAEKLISNFDEIVKQYLATIPRNEHWYARFSAPGGWIWGGYGNNITNSGQTGLAAVATLFTLGLYNHELWPDNKYVCSWYQLEVLKFFDGIRFDPDPVRRALMDGFDYGPFNSGPLNLAAAAHYYVALWPHAAALDPNLLADGFPASWETAGISFDPWPKQAPEVFMLKSGTADWANASIYSAHWTVGSRYIYSRARPEPPSIGYYKNKYPITGSDYYPNTQLARDYRSLLGIGNEPAKMLATHSPVTLEFKDAQGNKAGLGADGLPYSDIPDVEIVLVPEAEGGYEWYVALPEGAIDVSITGTGSGTYQLQTKLSGQPILEYPSVPVTAGATASLALDDRPEAKPLHTADGQTLLPVEKPGPYANTTLPGGPALTGNGLVRWGLFALAGCLGLGVFALVVGAGGFFLLRMRRKPIRPAALPVVSRQPVPFPARPQPSPVPTRARLVLRQGQASHPFVEFGMQPFTIGRMTSNLLAIQSPEASRVHARVEFVQGNWILTDQNSANGTFLNGAPITRQALHNGDQIRIGEVVLEFQVVS
jgi:hypothetical protein